ncbi:MAG: SPOR domain-containing protein [Rudaea sp.]|uniref:SPOR domain-containing protein n=1 Tax=Rudaea sp. TaxID=2136325 RepID=UPI0039E2C9BC
MFVRVLFLLLLALNIGAACWLYFAQRAPVAEAPAADAGVARLVLLSELDHSTAPDAATPTPPKRDADPKKETCLSIGTFATQADVRAAIKALTPLAARIQFRETRATEVRGYWVYLPAPANRERALDIARQLSSKGISDYYVVTAGEQPNAISLGLFREQGNAEKRLGEIRSLGFRPEMTQRSDEVPIYWIDIARNGDDAFDWRAHVPARSELHAQPIDCF